MMLMLMMMMLSMSDVDGDGDAKLHFGCVLRLGVTQLAGGRKVANK
jgi:hypothetical protein